MLALALAALSRYRRTGRRRWLAALAALSWPWANLHSGVVFGLYVLALYALEPFVAAVPPAASPPSGTLPAASGRSPPLAAAAPYLWTPAPASALPLPHPNGLAAPPHPFLLRR